MDFKSGAELLEQCAVRGMTISEVMKQRECDLTGVSMEDMEARMKDVLAVMRDSATLPLREPVTSIGGLIGGESARMEQKGHLHPKRRPGQGCHICHGCFGG